MWGLVGTDGVVNTTRAGVQAESVAAPLSDGSFVIAWTDTSLTGLDRSGTAVRAQVYAADGTKSGGEVLVNAWTPGSQYFPAVAPLAGGRFVVTWSDSTFVRGVPGGIKARIFSGSGNAVTGDILVKSLDSVAALFSAVTPLQGGGYLVTWDDNSFGALVDTTSTIRGQIFNADGTRRGGELQVSTALAGYQRRSASLGLPGGGFVVTWTDSTVPSVDGSGPAIKGQVFDSTGAKVGAAFLVNTTTQGTQDWSSLAALDDGRFVVTWSDESLSADDPSFSAIRGQVFAKDGSKSGVEFLVNTTTRGAQIRASVAALGDGRFVVTWADASVIPDGSASVIRGQVFAGDGSRSGTEFTISSPTGLGRGGGRVIALGKGRFAVTWGQFEPGATTDTDVRLQIVDATTYVGDQAAETVKGGTLADRLTGAGGNDSLDGGDGTDTAVYAGRRGDYIIRRGAAAGEILVTDCRSGSPDGTDSVRNVEVFAFSDGPVDLARILNAGPGGLTLAAAPLAENSPVGTVVGRLSATDADQGATLRYSLLDNAGGRFAVDPVTGQVTVRTGAVLDFETTPAVTVRARVTDRGILMQDQVFTIALANVAGSVTGTAGAESLAGSAEEDTILGLAGNDTIRGGAGNDTIDAGSGADLVVYAGRRSDYLVRQEAGTGAIIVADLRPGAPDGVDRIVNVESFSFADRTVSATAVLNNPPSGLDLTGGALPENSPAGTVVGQLKGQDADGTAGLSYALIDNAGGRFAVNAASGVITVRSGAVLDYETAPSMSVTARVTDRGGLSFDRTFAIRLSDASEAPSSLVLNGGRIAENAPAGTVVGTLVGSDPDARSVLTYTLVNDAGGRFAVDAATGVVRVQPGALLDFERTPQLALRARVVDPTGLALEKVVTVALDNVAGIVATGTDGADLLTGTAEEDGLLGLGGDDTLAGGDGGDTLEGGAGQDVLTGGAGADQFVFRGSSGRDVIRDFATTGAAHDLLQVDPALVATWEALLGRTSQVGSDLVIALSATDTVTLKAVALANFTAADVLFSA